MYEKVKIKQSAHNHGIYGVDYSTGFDGEIWWDSSKPDGQPRRCLEVSKARKCFGFRAKTPFDEGLKKTIDWYQRHKSR